MNEYVDLNYYQRNREVILNTAKGYYENDKERLREQVRDKYRSLSEEEKNKKREYGKNRYQNIDDDRSDGERDSVQMSQKIMGKNCYMTG